MEKLTDVIFYQLEKAIKTYRQFAQRQLAKAGITLTIDQWLILKIIDEYPGISQKEIAKRVFKDNASVTRIIELLVSKKYIVRREHGSDRRKTDLHLTAQTQDLLKKVNVISRNNRQKALKALSPRDIKTVHDMLNVIVANCS
jgi:MarR family transcriptional regulator for hemolysin